MNRSRLVPRLCFRATVAMTLVAVICRSVAMLTQFDADVGYFNDTPLTAICSVLCFAAPVLLGVGVLFIPKGTLPTQWTQLPHNIAAAVPAVALLLCGIVTMVAFFTGDQGYMYPVLALVAVASATYFGLSMTPVATDRPTLLAAVGYAPILWGLASIAESYADLFTTMNSPIKISLQLGFLSVLLMITAELRFRLGKALPRGALCFHCLCTFFCLNASVPVLVALAADVHSNLLHTLYAVCLLAIGLYSILRLIPYLFFPSVTEEMPDASDPQAPAAAESDVPQAGSDTPISDSDVM